MRSVDTMVVIVVATIIIMANAILSVMLLMRIKVLKVRTNAYDLQQKHAYWRQLFSAT